MGSNMDWFHRSRILVAGCCLSLLTMWATGTHAQTTKKAPVKNQAATKLETTGLGLASSEVAFFNSSLNMRKAWQQQLESGWIAELRQVPYIHQLEAFLQDQWDNPRPQTEQVKTFLSSPIARDVFALFRDMGAQECFVIGEQNWCEFLAAMSTLQYDIASMTGDEEALKNYFLEMKKEDLDAIPIPTTIIGFQLTEDTNARNQLDALEGILQLALGSSDELKPLAEGLRRKDLNNGQILTMTFEAEDIPWQNIPLQDADAQEQIDRMADLLAGRQLVLSLGVIGNRLMMSISESSDTLLSLGRDANLLTTDALKQLTSNQPADLRGVGYTSGEFRNAAWESNFGNYFERIALQISGQIVALAEDPEKLEAWQEKLLEDCEWLDERVSAMMPEFSPGLVYAYQTADGSESLTYDWTPSWLLENAKPFAVTQHGGTNPLILIATRQRWLTEVNEMVEGILEELPNHVEQLLEAGLAEDEDAAEKVRFAVDEVLPIIENIYAALRDKIVPSLDGNESLVSITALATAAQLSEDSPPPPQPLPLPEVGMVMKLKNKDLFLAGCDDIVQSINTLIDLAREQNPGNVPPNARIPEPMEESLAGGGTRYSYPLGAPAPWDQFEPQLAINKQVAVLGLSTRHVRDMYQGRPLAARPGWYSPKDSVAAVGFVDFAGIFRSLRPWVQYGLSMTNDDLQQPLGPPQGEVPVPTGSDVLQIWDTFKKLGKAAGTTTIDKNDVTVSHWIWVGE